MKRCLAAMAAAVLCVCTTGCLQQAQQLPLEEVIPAVTLPAAPETEKTNDAATNEPDLILDCGGWTVSLPREYAHLLLTESAEASGDRQALLSVYEKASVEAAAKDMGESRGMGFLFGITMLEGQAYQDWLNEDFPGYTLFARDDAGRYFFRVEPTDVRFYRSHYTAEDTAAWKTLAALAVPTCEQFITANGLTPYTRAEVLISSVPATANHGQTLAKAYSLPAEVTAPSDWNYDADIQKIAEYPAAELELYDLREPWEATLYLRWGNCEGIFQGTHINPGGLTLQHSLTDADSDGQQELVVIGTPGTGTGVSVDRLHIFQKADSGIVRYTLFNIPNLRDAVQNMLDPATRTLQLGSSCLTLPAGLDLTDFALGNLVNFSVSNGVITGSWGIQFARAGTTLASGYDYAARLSADIALSGAHFLLTNLRLSPA